MVCSETSNNCTFPKSSRLLSQDDFFYLRSKAKRIKVNFLLAYFKLSRLNQKETRIGFSISTKVGKSHVRNRLKRLLRERFRHLSVCRELGIDLLIVVDPFLLRQENPEHLLLAAFDDLMGKIREDIKVS